jgi:flagellin-specific chaperone FliS
MIGHLERANMNRDPEPLREVIALLEDLNGAWKAIS